MRSRIRFTLILTLYLSIAALPAYCSDKENSMVKMSGSYGMSFGIAPDEFVWKRANGDYQEKNWRYIDNDLDVNTYDPRIFDRYQLEIKTDTRTPWNAYTEIKIDPWSFVGVGRETIFSSANDSVTVEYKYWEATGKVINENYRTHDGNSVGYDEMKVKGNKVDYQRASPSLWSAPAFDFSKNNSAEIEYLFRPVRKLWVEYQEEPVYLKVFPIADQAEALSSDDPLRLSNNHVYWAPSPWLFSFDPGMALTTAQQEAKWNWDLVWFAEDSNRQFLTFLRGLTFAYEHGDMASFRMTAATPMSLWDYYQEGTSFPMAFRTKITPSDKLQVGSTYTLKLGVHKHDIRGINQALGFDVDYNLWDLAELFGEYAASYNYLRHPDDSKQINLGQAYKTGIKSSFDLRGGNRFNWDVSLALMSKDFRPGLADYKDTRVDRDWGRHIWFDPITPEDQGIRIGDSIDINRYVIGMNARSILFNNLVDFYFNFRNAHNSYDDKFIENIIRLEAVLNPMADVQLKGLALHRRYPDSIGDYDQFLRDRYTDELLRNYRVDDGYEVELVTLSGGAKVDFFDKRLSVYGIYEATNDPQDFPRSALNSIAFNTVVIEDNIRFNRLITQVYDQDFFDLPPYGFYNIWKGVVMVRPLDNFSVRYTHVTNGNRNYAALIDDNHNHDAIEVGYAPVKNITTQFGYSVSRIINLNRAIDANSRAKDFEQHHNIYAQLNWDFKKDHRLTVQFGEAWLQQQPGSLFGPKWISTSPAVLDTVEIVRIFYQGKF